MVQFINLPTFQASPLMDLSPIAGALERNRMLQMQQEQATAAAAQQQRVFAEKQRQFDATNSLAQAKLGLSREEANREAKVADARHRLLDAQAGYYRRGRNRSAPGNGQGAEPQFAMRENGAMYLVGDGGADVLAGGDGGSGRPAISTFGPAGMTTSDIPGLVTRKGGASDPYATKLAERQRAIDALPPAEREALLEQLQRQQQETARAVVSPQNSQHGEAGRLASTVPGVIVDDKGAPSEFASRVAASQRSLNAVPEADRRRFLEWKSVQDRFIGLFGKAKAGHAYDRYGRQVPLGPVSQWAEQAEQKDRAIGNMMTQLDQAEKVMLSSTALGRAVAGQAKQSGGFGRLFNNVAGLEELAAAHDQYKEGIMQTVFALSGKTVTNREMGLFLALYMPQSGESTGLIKDKTRRLRKMLATLVSKVRQGVLYEDAERYALASNGGAPTPPSTQAAPASASVGAPTLTQAAPSPSADRWTTLPSGARIREKK